MASLLVVMAVLIVSINLVNLANTGAEIDNILSILSENRGFFPKSEEERPSETTQPPREKHPHMSPETPFETRYFHVFFNDSGNIVRINTGSIAAVDSAAAAEYAKNALNSSKMQGRVDAYIYRIVSYDSETMVVFLDCSRQISSFLSYLAISCVIGAAALILVFLLLLVLSKRFISPMIENMEKQRRFITDASHEIKTPLSVISANIDILELEQGSSEWTKSIKNQTARLDALTKNLLELARLEEDGISLKSALFSLSEAASDSVAAFNAYALKYKKTITAEIAPKVEYNGDEDLIKQLISILLSNAVKYSVEGDNVIFRLSQSQKSTKIEVINRTESLTSDDAKHIFDRFYRADPARTGGGHGIGLSSAQAIAALHKGKISAKLSADTITFTVQL